MVETETGSELPDFVKDEFEAYDECVISTMCSYACVVPTARIEAGGPFPASGVDTVLRADGRRMAQTVAHLVDHVISNAPLRQWVLFLPIPLRYRLATHPHLLSPVLRVILRAISTVPIKQA
ncbi:MAG: hypothetical protein JSR71_00645 [Proteobacteria bacterium]|nr:hypothetical protein [Pseudomonadota bacterium]